MVKNEMMFCYLGDHYEQLMFEYNKPKSVIKKLFNESFDKLYREEPYREEPQ